MVSLSSIKVKTLEGLSKLGPLWSKWNIRGFILGSLIFQSFLILISPFRKRTSNGLVIGLIWLAYLVSDYVANQAVGLIPKKVNEIGKSDPDTDILAFWAPFLLLHLGGPDTITALALEDNELWIRSLLQLFAQIAATGRVFIQSLPNSTLWAPTILMFIAGICKYAERTLSFYHARLTKFKSSMLTDPDPGPNYAKLMEAYASSLDSGLPTRFETIPEQKDQSNSNTTSIQQSSTTMTMMMVTGSPPLSDVQLVRDAYRFFEKYKGLYVDLIFTYLDRQESRAYFLARSPEQAFKVLEVELNFTYEVFFTKMIVIHKTIGIISRTLSFVLESLSLLIWHFTRKEGRFRAYDVRLTYTLLVGAIVLDVVSYFRLRLSDWKIAHLRHDSRTRASCFGFLLSFRDRTWGRFTDKKSADCGPCLRRIFFRRWSESISQFNLIDYCVNLRGDNIQKFMEISGIKDIFDGLDYVSKKWFTDDLRDFIFQQLKYKSELAADPKEAEEVCEARGDWVLRNMGGTEFDPFAFYPWTSDVEYDESLLLWHIATELCYQDEIHCTPDTSTTVDPKWYQKIAAAISKPFKLVGRKSCCFSNSTSDTNPNSNSTSNNTNPAGPNPRDPDTAKKYREFSKTLSDYMMYLLIRQPNMMFAVAGISEVRFRDTCAEAKKYFKRVLPTKTKQLSKDKRHNKACRRISKVNTDINPREIKGDRSKSVLFDACRLARELNSLNDKQKINKWEAIAKVWVELLCYAAMHIRSNAHAAQLKQGGELLTLVWLLMVHLGLGKQFRINHGHARSKLIISK